MNKYLSYKLRIFSFFCMILVVFIHAFNPVGKALESNLDLNRNFTTVLEYAISDSFCRVAVPFFFCTSGYLFFLSFSGTFSDYIEKLKRRTWTLFVPYLLCSIICVLFYFTLQLFPFTHAFFSKELIRNMSIYKIGYIILLDPLPYQLWFLRDLMLLVLISPLINLLTKKPVAFVLFIALFIIWFFKIDLRFLSGEGLLFFSIGAFLARNTIPTKLIVISRSLIILPLWIVIVFIHLYLFIKGPDFASWLILAYKLCIIIEMVVLWNFYDVLFKNKDMENSKLLKISTFSFFLFLFHEPILSIFQKASFKILKEKNAVPLLSYFFCTIVTIIICILLGWFLKRYFNNFYKILTGGR